MISPVVDKLAKAMVITLVLLMQSQAVAWNSLGHRIIAQIAYDNLTPQALRLCNRYNRAVVDGYKRRHPLSLVNSASWMDTLRRPDQFWMKPMHYIDLPFSWDGTPVKPPNEINAVSAIEHALRQLNNPQTSLPEKGFQLRVLLHVTGDIHQPMHAVSLYSHKFPQGDKGGNLYYLGSNPVADNLHAYWDRGGGLLLFKKPQSRKQVERRARLIEQKWPCDKVDMAFQPRQWANESHKTALSEAYQIAWRAKPSREWQKKVKQVSEERLAFAGCRLANILNQLTGAADSSQ